MADPAYSAHELQEVISTLMEFMGIEATIVYASFQLDVDRELQGIKHTPLLKDAHFTLLRSAIRWWKKMILAEEELLRQNENKNREAIRRELTLLETGRRYCLQQFRAVAVLSDIDPEYVIRIALEEEPDDNTHRPDT